MSQNYGLLQGIECSEEPLELFVYSLLMRQLKSLENDFQTLRVDVTLWQLYNSDFGQSTLKSP